MTKHHSEKSWITSVKVTTDVNYRETAQLYCIGIGRTYTKLFETLLFCRCGTPMPL